MTVSLKRLCGAMAASMLLAGGALAQPAGAKPITLVVPLAPGGAGDALARIWAESAARTLGTSIVIENKTGANGGIAASYVAKQPPNGQTLMMATVSAMAFNPYSYKSLAYKTSDFAGVALLATTSQVVVVAKPSPINTFDELVARAKAAPKAVTFGSGGKGNTTHLNIEILARHFGMDLTHVPYKAAPPAIMGLIGGETDFSIDAIGSVIAQTKGGRIKPLLIVGPKRSPDLPGTPTAAELGMDKYIGGGWFGLVAPAGTPQPVLDRLNAATNAMWSDPAMTARLEQLYLLRLPDTDPGAVMRYIERDSTLWGPLITSLNIRSDD